MHILVCMKQNLNGVLEQDEYSNTNPNDLDALECALQVKEKLEDATVTAITMGPQKSREVLKEAIALGGEEGILLTDSVFQGSDTLATATVLATAIKKKENVRLVLCGCRSHDGETGQIGPELAELLAYSFGGYITKVLEVTQDFIKCEKQTDLGKMEVTIPLPIVLTVKEGSYPIRNKTFWGIQKAQRQEIKVWGNEMLHVPEEDCGLKGSATHVVHTEKVPKERISESVFSFQEGVAEQVLEQVFGVR